nr:hypothetical protein CFP56_63961 [Quercus suber]
MLLPLSKVIRTGLSGIHQPILRLTAVRTYSCCSLRDPNIFPVVGLRAGSARPVVSMPESGNPGVSVFHFTSRISNAKIRKYKQATERGMSVGKKDVRKVSETTKLDQNPSFSIQESSAKRQKTQSRSICPEVTAPAIFSETLATSQPKRESTLKFRYSDDMVMSARDRANAARNSTSELSSLASTPQVERISAIEREPTPPLVDEDYGMLSTYYIMDDDDDENGNRKTSEPAICKVATPAPTQPLALQQVALPDEPLRPLPSPPSEPKRKARSKIRLNLSQSSHVTPAPLAHQSSSQQHGLPAQAMPHYPQHSLPAPPVIPRVVLMDMDLASDTKNQRGPVSVEQMIRSIDALSLALSSFSGVPFVPGASGPPLASTLQPATSKNSKGTWFISS